MRDTPILTQRRKNCILVKTNLEKSFILGLLFVFQLTVSLLYLYKSFIGICQCLMVKYVYSLAKQKFMYKGRGFYE